MTLTHFSLMSMPVYSFDEVGNPVILYTLNNLRIKSDHLSP
jgi:hypothetical protein